MTRAWCDSCGSGIWMRSATKPDMTFMKAGARVSHGRPSFTKRKSSLLCQYFSIINSLKVFSTRVRFLILQWKTGSRIWNRGKRRPKGHTIQHSRDSVDWAITGLQAFFFGMHQQPCFTQCYIVGAWLSSRERSERTRLNLATTLRHRQVPVIRMLVVHCSFSLNSTSRTN